MPYDYEKVADGKLAIYFKKPSGWGSSVNCYAYNTTNGTNNKLTGEWPGTAMEKLPNGVYRCVLDEATAKSGKVLFNSNGAQAPASGGFDIKSYALYDQNGYCETIVPSDKIVTKLDVKFNTDVIETAKVGKKVKLTAQASGGSGDYTYKFILTDNKGNWYKIKDYSKDNTSTWTPGAVGDKTLYVDVKDSKGAYVRVGLSMKVTTLNVNFTASPEKTAKVGSNVKLTAQASGGSGDYTYKFIVTDNKGNWYKIKDYSKDNTATWIPGAVGNKTLYVDVKDSEGTYKRVELPIEITKQTEKLRVKFTSKSDDTVKLGDKVKLTAQATGGTGNYFYQFVVCNPDNNWYRIRGYEKDNSCFWTPKMVGKTMLYVDTVDGNGNYWRNLLSVNVQ